MDHDSKLVALLSSPFVPPDIDPEAAINILQMTNWDVDAALELVMVEIGHTAQHLDGPGAQPVVHTTHRPPTTTAPDSVGPLETLGSLALEFKHNNDFKRKVGQLSSEGYGSWRRVRGDGNCFYRAVGFGLLEWFVSPDSRASRCVVATAVVKQLANVHFPEFSQQEAHEQLLQHLGQIVDGASNDGNEAHDTLHRSFVDPNGWIDLALVRALRHATASFLISNTDNEELGNGLSPGIIVVTDGYADMEDFCQRIVLPEGIEAEGIVQKMLPSLLGINLRIIFLDRQASEGETVPHVDYCGGDGPRIYVQLRPGHYDLIYQLSPSLVAAVNLT